MTNDIIFVSWLSESRRTRTEILSCAPEDGPEDGGRRAEVLVDAQDVGHDVHPDGVGGSLTRLLRGSDRDKGRIRYMVRQRKEEAHRTWWGVGRRTARSLCRLKISSLLDTDSHYPLHREGSDYPSTELEGGTRDRQNTLDDPLDDWRRLGRSDPWTTHPVDRDEERNRRGVWTTVSNYWT